MYTYLVVLIVLRHLKKALKGIIRINFVRTMKSKPTKGRSS